MSTPGKYYYKKIQFLWEMHRLRAESKSQIFYLGEMWMNQNYIRKFCWKMGDDSRGFKDQLIKGDP